MTSTAFSMSTTCRGCHRPPPHRSRRTPMRMRSRTKLIVIATLAVAINSCKREERGFRVQPPSAEFADLPVLTSFHAGPTTAPSHVSNPYDQNAYALQQGQTFYENFNCVGCHFHGGGGIGPPLMDDKW